MTVGAAQIREGARAAGDALRGELARIKDARGEHATRRAELQQACGVAAAELGQALLPALDPASIARAVQLTGYVPLRDADPIGELQLRREKTELRLAALAADPRYATRDAERVRIATQRDDLEDFRTTLVATATRCAHPRFERLLEVRFGTDDYRVGWWRASYYGDRRAAKQILENFPAGTTFAQVRSEYLTTTDAIRDYDEQLAALQAKVDDLAAMEIERAELEAELPDLAAVVAAEWRAKLMVHLGGLEMSAIGDRLVAAPDIAVLVKRWDGLRAKLRYLDDLQGTQLQQTEDKLVAEIAKCDRDYSKFHQPKYRNQVFDDALYQKRFVDRPAYFRRSLDRYDRTYRTVYVFDDYDRAPLASDWLWWDLMTDGRYDGGFLPEVASYRSDHPEYRYERGMFDGDDGGGDDSIAAAAVAVLDAESPDLGGAATTDPS